MIMMSSNSSTHMNVLKLEIEYNIHRKTYYYVHTGTTSENYKYLTNKSLALVVKTTTFQKIGSVGKVPRRNDSSRCV